MTTLYLKHETDAQLLDAAQRAGLFYCEVFEGDVLNINCLRTDDTTHRYNLSTGAWVAV